MRDYPHAVLIDLIALHDSAAVHGCGLEPQLMEMLLDRHPATDDTVSLGYPIGPDGPLRAAPLGLTRIDREAQGSETHSHARR